MSSAGALKITTPSDHEIVMTRLFDARRQLVFDALTKPELVRQWYGPRGWTMKVCEIDLRAGGKWRYVTNREDGKEIGQFGVYREVTPPERIVNTELWEDWKGVETVVTTVLLEDGGKTTMTATILFPSQEVRDILLKSGVEDGANQTYDKLADYLASVSH